MKILVRSISVAIFTAAVMSALPARAACPTPASVANYMPGAYVPPKVQNVCSSQQNSDFYTACLDPSSTQMTCSTWSMANMMCGACLESKKTDNSWGALLLGMGIVSLNVAGCADIQGSLTCAKAYEAYTGCVDVACESTCPVTDQQSFTLYNQCVQAATTGGCSSYNQTVQAQCTTDASVNLQQCFNLMSFQAGFNTFAPMFCSSGPPMDAGVPEDSGVTPPADAGVQKDAGKPGSDAAPADAGDDGFTQKKGCHCDSSGESAATPSALLGFVVLSALQRILSRKRPLNN